MEFEASKLRELLDQASAGDADAFSLVCRAHADRLIRQARVLCGEATLAEDLAHDTLVAAWESLGQYRGRCQFFTWLCAILLNRYRNTLRKAGPRPLPAFFEGDREGVRSALETQVDPGLPPDQRVLQNEQALAMRRCIEALPFKQQEVIHLRFYVDHSIEGIAAALNCSEGTVKSRLFHALENLRSMKALPVAGRTTSASVNPLLP